MKYLKLYEQFRLIKESIGGKNLILFSGPSASGKTYLATNPESKLSKKFKHWYEDINSNEILIGTDTLMGKEYNAHGEEVLYKLMENYGLIKYTEIARTYEDQPWLIEVYESNLYKKFREEASEEELKIWDEMNSQVAYSVKNCTGSIKNQEDGRVCGMAWVAYLHPAKTVIFDDVDTAIKNYFKVHDILCFTPFDDYLSNIKSRINSSNPAERISVDGVKSGIYQYMQWFKAVDGSNKDSALDNKFYTIETAKKLLEDTGYKKSDEILNQLGVKLDSTGFYIGKNENVECNQVINTRDENDVKSIKL